MTTAWEQQRERSNPFALWLIVFITQHMGRWMGRLLLYPITAYFVLTAPRIRRGSRHYLRRALGRPATLFDIARHIHCFASTLLDRIFMLTDRFEALDVRIQGPEPLLRYAAEGRGCLLLGSHLGSFEVMRNLARTRPELKVKVLMHRHQNAMFMQAMERLSPNLGESIIDTAGQGSETLLRVKDALDAGYSVGLLGDRLHAEDRPVRCRFLGDGVDFPSSPILIASLLRASVILCFGLYRGGNRYDLYFEELAERIEIERASRDAELQRWAQRYADRLEHYTRLAPYNWFNFYDFWNDEARRNTDAQASLR
jgi:predicted LPLAT superfamily acyltransferase